MRSSQAPARHKPIFTLLSALSLVLLIGIPTVTSAGCYRPFGSVVTETYSIDPDSDTYRALVQECQDDDYSCENLCLEILLQDDVYTLEDTEEPEIVDCVVLDSVASKVEITYDF